jgi:hypothetical protein
MAVLVRDPSSGPDAFELIVRSGWCEESRPEAFADRLWRTNLAVV